MNFRQLEVLISVIQYGSFSKAAEDLYLTQPTVSTHISTLEQELGVQLIERGRKNVRPTQAGAVFYEYANGLLRMREHVLESMKHYPDLLGGTLEIASSTVPASYVLPDMITDFHSCYPYIRFNIRELNSEGVHASLLANEAELGFVGMALHNEKYAYEELCSDSLVIITPRREPFLSMPKDEFPSELLKTTPFILRTSGSATQKEADSFLVNVGISPQSLCVVAYMDSIEAIKQSVCSGLGIAILSEIAVRDMEAQQQILVFRSENPFMQRKLYCMRRADQALSPCADLFLSYIKSRS